MALPTSTYRQRNILFAICHIGKESSLIIFFVGETVEKKVFSYVANERVKR